MYFIDQRSFYIQLFLLKGLCGIDSLWGLLVLRDVTAVCLCVVSGKSINMNSKHIRVYDVSAQILMCVSHIFFRLCICVSGPNMSVSSSWDGSFIKFNMFVFLGGKASPWLFFVIYKKLFIRSWSQEDRDDLQLVLIMQKARRLKPFVVFLLWVIE